MVDLVAVDVVDDNVDTDDPLGSAGTFTWFDSIVGIDDK
jgi:hypothetical protein